MVKSFENGQNFGTHDGFVDRWKNMGESFEDEPRVLDKHDKKTIAALLTGEYDKYILSHGEFEMPEDAEQAFYDLRKAGRITDEDEKGFLRKIARPVDRYEIGYQNGGMEQGESRQRAFETAYNYLVKGNKHYRRILGEMGGGSFDNPDMVSAENLKIFLSKYETPMDFEADSESLLRRIKGANSAEKYEEYVADMAGFFDAVYGKRAEYYQTLKKLDRNAEKFGANEESGGVLIEADDGGGGEDETKLGFGVFEMSEAAVKGEVDGDESEDATFIDGGKRVFALFDGAGGSKNGRLASQCAKTVTETFMRTGNLDDLSDFGLLMNQINNAINSEARGGASTGVIATVKEEAGEKKLIFASVGDSRLYIYRDGVAYQMTHDDNVTEKMLDDAGITDEKQRRNYLDHGISNSFGGGQNLKISYGNSGQIDLVDGDRIVICSDGVTGDVESERMSNEEMAEILKQCPNDQDAAQALVQMARKNDDRTAIVVSV